MDRFDRKKMKQDEFVDWTMRLFQHMEENPRPYILGALAVIVLVVGGFGLHVWNQRRAEAAADLFARAQSALEAPLARDEAPRPNDPYRPTFASPEERLAEALRRLEAAESTPAPLGDLALWLHGQALLEEGKAEESVAEMRRSAERLGDDPTMGGPVKASLAKALAAAGKHEESAALWEKLTDAESGYPGDLAWEGLAKVREAAGDEKGAEEAWQQVLDLYPESPVAAAARAALGR